MENRNRRNGDKRGQVIRNSLFLPLVIAGLKSGPGSESGLKTKKCRQHALWRQREGGKIKRPGYKKNLDLEQDAPATTAASGANFQ